MKKELEALDDLLSPTVVDFRLAVNLVKRYHAGNTALMEALMGMCLQYLERLDGKLWHDFMSAGEQAMQTLAEAGMIKDEKLDWAALDDRKLKPITWEQAVNKYVTDKAERERLLALGDAP